MTYPIYTTRRDPDHQGKRSLSAIHGIVVHYTYGFNAGDASVIGAHDSRSVSAHYFIADDDDPGATPHDILGIHEFVPINTIANAVGKCIPGWGNADVISVEIGNRGNEKPTPRQLAKLDWLIADIDRRLGRKVPIKGHFEIALPYGRKAGDPNATFPLANYKAYRRHAAPDNTVKLLENTTVRASAMFGKKVDYLHKGDKVQVFEKSKWCSWWRVGFGAKRAWIPGRAIGK